MDVISTKVNLVIEPIDGFTGGRKLQGTVYARIGTNSYAMKKDGCFIFFNKPAGKYKITVGGNCYLSSEFEIELDDNFKTVTVMLLPSRSYKFLNDVVKLYGKAECPAKVCFLYSNEQVRILGEYKSGETKISMFFSDKTPMRTEFKYLIGEGVYTLKHLSGTEYETDRPLKFDIDFESVIGVSCEIAVSEHKEYFIAMNGNFKEAEIICGKRREKLELFGENTEYDIKEM